MAWNRKSSRIFLSQNNFRLELFLLVPKDVVVVDAEERTHGLSEFFCLMSLRKFGRTSVLLRSSNFL